MTSDVPMMLPMLRMKLTRPAMLVALLRRQAEIGDQDDRHEQER